MNEINEFNDPEADDVDIMSIDDSPSTDKNQEFNSRKRKIVDDQKSADSDQDSLETESKNSEIIPESQTPNTDQVLNSDILSKLNAELQLKNPEAYQSGYRIIDMEKPRVMYNTGQRYQMWRLDENGRIILQLRPYSEHDFEYKSINSRKRKLADEPDSQENDSQPEKDSQSENESHSENESQSPGNDSLFNKCKTFSCFNCLDDITPSELNQIRAENKFDLVCRKCRVFCWTCQSKLNQKELEINAIGGFRSCNKCYTKLSSVFI